MKTRKGDSFREYNSPKRKGPREAHTQHTDYGMGDHYGTGFKAPLGRIRGSTFDVPGWKPVKKGQLKTPPKGVV